MPNQFDAAVFPKVLVNNVPLAIVYTAVDSILPAAIAGDDRRKYIPNLRPDALNDPGQQMQALVADLIARSLLDKFKMALSRSSPGNVRLQGILSGELQVDQNGQPDPGTVHSLTNRRQPFLNSKTFFDVMMAARYQVCAMWAALDIRGTGFLVAPDLVITARHVLTGAGLIQQEPIDTDKYGTLRTRDRQTPGSHTSLACVFDYWTLANPFGITPPPAGVKVVFAHQNWLVWSSARHPNDGLSHYFGYPPDIRESFDCAVIRLSEQIGLTAVSNGGGRLRGWIRLDHGHRALSKGDAIAILQHPAKGPQGFDRGDFSDQDPSETRMFYSTEATGGSSGSPCFDSDAKLVGFHNAGHPTGFEGATKDCNQGVRIDKVVTAMPPELVLESEKGLPAESALWSISDDPDNPVPVLGRTEFKKAVLQLFDPRAEKRVLVVEEAVVLEEANEASKIGKSGKSFSIGILKAIARDRPSFLLEFPAKKLKGLAPEEFLGQLGRSIGLPDASLGQLPARPEDERQLTRWYANDLPNWFGQLVETRALEAGTAGRETVEVGASSPATGRDLVTRELIWIVIDDIHKNPPEGSLKELVAGMMGVTDTQPVLRPGLRALRWLIIGHVPDFFRKSSIQYLRDEVSQKAIDEQAWVDCIQAAFVSSGQECLFNPEQARQFYKFSRDLVPGVNDPALVLQCQARAVLFAIRRMLEKAL